MGPSNEQGQGKLVLNLRNFGAVVILVNLGGPEEGLREPEKVTISNYKTESLYQLPPKPELLPSPPLILFLPHIREDPENRDSISVKVLSTSTRNDD